LGFSAPHKPIYCGVARGRGERGEGGTGGLADAAHQADDGLGDDGEHQAEHDRNAAEHAEVHGLRHGTVPLGQLTGHGRAEGDGEEEECHHLRLEHLGRELGGHRQPDRGINAPASRRRRAGRFPTHSPTRRWRGRPGRRRCRPPGASARRGSVPESRVNGQRRSAAPRCCPWVLGTRLRIRRPGGRPGGDIQSGRRAYRGSGTLRRASNDVSERDFRINHSGGQWSKDYRTAVEFRRS
jgi:hypothetical protein